MWLLEALAIYDLEGEPTMDIVLLLDFLVYAASDVSTIIFHATFK